MVSLEVFLSELAQSPWAFGLMMVLAIISAAFPVWKGAKLLWDFVQAVIRNGLLSARGFLRRKVSQRVREIEDSTHPGAHYSIMILTNIALLSPVLLWGLILVAILGVNNLMLGASILQSVAIEPAIPILSTWPINLALFAMAANVLAFAGNTIFNLLVLWTLVADKKDRGI